MEEDDLAILQDALWVVVSIAVLVLRPFGISAAGNVWIALVAAIVAYFGIKQWQGIRKVWILVIEWPKQ